MMASNVDAPVEGLPRVVSYIAGHNEEGKSVFLSTDRNEHHRELVNKSVIANTIYPAEQHPVELNGEIDTKYAYHNEPIISTENGSVCRIIDFAPGGISPMHRVNSLDYAVVIEGVFRMILDSGEERIMRRGDIAVQRSTAQSWVNVTGNGLLSARILLVHLNMSTINQEGNKVQRELGVLQKDYVSGKGTNFYGSEYFESEF